jgi:RNA polymerase sigma-70 factor (ECF subfamily)
MATTAFASPLMIDLRRGRDEFVEEDRDADLVALARTEPHAALRLVMRRHGPAVFRFCRAQLRDAALADDVHQQVFIEAHRDLPTFAGRSTLRAWLFGIARHRVIDAALARRRTAERVDADASPDPIDPAGAPDEQLDRARLRRALAASLATLPDEVRGAVLLRYQQGFSFEEMAEVCKEKPGTLQARVARALRALRTQIEAQL